MNIPVGEMIRFLQDRITGSIERLLQTSALGPLEARVMQVLWTRGECSVHDVVKKMERPLAYTTVMTTLDRLYKKDLLSRRKSERAFIYLPRYSRTEWERQVTDRLVAGYLAGPRPLQEHLLSCFVDSLGHHDRVLLDELEKKIQKKRKELRRRGRP